MSESMPMHPPSSRGGFESWDKSGRPPGAGALRTLKAQLERVRAQPQLGLDLLRIYLGVALFVRAILFLSDTSRLSQMLAGSWFTSYALAHAVVMAHLAGGLMLAVGCYTRLAAAVQIPVLAGAVFFVHLREGLLGPSESLELSALVLVALVVYAIFGSGPLSLDHYLERPSRERPTPGTGARSEEPGAAALASPEPSPVAPPEDWAAPPRGGLEQDPHGKLIGVDPGLHDTPQAASRYRDVKLELTYVLVALTVLFVLFAEAQYMWAFMVFIIGFITFGVWRIGRARFE